MKRTSILVVALLALSLPALAEDFKFGNVTFGALQNTSDTISSKFLEYRDIPQGVVAPMLRFEGQSGSFRYDFYGRDITQKDQFYLLKLSNDTIKIRGGWLGIPHNFGNGGRSPLGPVTDSNWQLADTIQRNYQYCLGTPNNTPTRNDPANCPPPAAVGYPYLLALVTPALNAAPPNIDLKLQRGRGNISFSIAPKGASYDVGVSYLHERRSGTRSANGTSFGFGNVVETPEPLLYVTQDLGFYASFNGSWGSAKAAIRYNDFKNSFDTFLWDNPFRITDSTDGSAYTAPSASTRNGPVFGRMALSPDNNAWTESIGATFKFGARTRLTADIAFGQWRQNEDPLIPWTTNTAIVTPGGQPATTAALPATVLDGKIDTTSLAAFFTTKLTDAVGLNFRYRHYDHDNKTPRYELHDGYVRFDAVWEDIPRITVPFGYTNDTLDANVTFGTGVLGLEAGWKYNKIDRTFRETGKTTENVFRFVADVRSGWVVLRGIGEFGSRDYDAYDAAFAEEHSFLPEPGAVPANQTVLRRYDQAKRDLTRWGGQVELSPGDGKFTAFASYLQTKFEYDQGRVECEDVSLFPGQSQFCPGGEQSPLGLVDDKYDVLNLEANFAPNDKVTVYAFYSWEDVDQLQTGRQSGATINFNPLDVWTSDVVNKVNSVGAGADFKLTEKWDLGLFGRHQDVDGVNVISLLPGYSTSIYGTNAALRDCTAGNESSACSIPEFDDTKLTYVAGWVKYKVAKQWTAGLGVSYEDYQIRDSQTGNALNYMPASFFLQANNRDYQAWVGWLNLSYSWQ